MRCSVCRGEIEERLIRYIQELGDRVMIIENVPAEVCGQCGEKLLRPEIAFKIEKLVKDAPAPHKKTEVAVYDLAEVA